MKKLVLITLAAILVLACAGLRGKSDGDSGDSSSSSSTTFTLKIKGAERPFEKKVTVAVLRPDLKETGILLANWDIDMSDKSVRGAPRPKQPGQIMIDFGLEGDGKDFKKPLQVGDYTDKIKWMEIVTDVRNEQVVYRPLEKNGQAKVTITEITDDLVRGSLELTLADNSVSGPFEAKIISKKRGD